MSPQTKSVPSAATAARWVLCFEYLKGFVRSSRSSRSVRVILAQGLWGTNWNLKNWAGKGFEWKFAVWTPTNWSYPLPGKIAKRYMKLVPYLEALVKGVTRDIHPIRFMGWSSPLPSCRSDVSQNCKATWKKKGFKVTCSSWFDAIGFLLVRAIHCRCIVGLFMQCFFCCFVFRIRVAVLSNTLCFLHAARFNPFFWKWSQCWPC